MQTPAEKRLVDELVRVLKASDGDRGEGARILNVGAGQSLSIETQLTRAGCVYVSDRTDVDDCDIDHPSVGRTWRCSAEAMPDVGASDYVAVFANYVLEHVPDVGAAAREIYRILKPSGRFIVSVPNPTAPEFVVSRLTPLWLHRMVRGEEAWETHYDYQNVDGLKSLFVELVGRVRQVLGRQGHPATVGRGHQRPGVHGPPARRAALRYAGVLDVLRGEAVLAGFRTLETCYYGFTEGYLARFPVINLLARLYDRMISALGVRRFMGNVCVIFQKPA